MLMRKSSNRQIVKSFVVALTVTALVGGMPAAVSLAGPMELVVNGSFEDTTNGANKFWGTAAQGGSVATGWTGGADYGTLPLAPTVATISPQTRPPKIASHCPRRSVA